MNSKSLTHRQYFAIALPFIVSTVTQPLLGAVDTAVVGHLDSPVYIGGVAIGTMILNTLYWLFGFLRVSTTSQSAMALGTKKKEDITASLVRPFTLAAGIGLLFVMLQIPIWHVARSLMAPESKVAEQAGIYFSILIWGAPFVLLNYTVIGWLMGQAKARETLITQVSGNILNIILDILFVTGFGLGVAGVAVASLIAQFSSLALGLYFVHQTAPIPLSDYLAQLRMKSDDIRTIASSNTDLMLRTACLLIMFNLMTKVGASLGTTELATNAVLMQVTFIISYIFDGIANTSSVFSGKSVGQQDAELMSLTFLRNRQWTIGVMLIMSSIVGIFGRDLGRIFTNIPEILANYQTVYYWGIIFPIAAGFGLTLYGIFTGSGATRPVRNSSFKALLGFLGALAVCVPLWGNTGLWLAFIIFYIGRGAFLYPYVGQVESKIK